MTLKKGANKNGEFEVNSLGEIFFKSENQKDVIGICFGGGGGGGGEKIGTRGYSSGKTTNTRTNQNVANTGDSDSQGKYSSTISTPEDSFKVREYLTRLQDQE